MQAFEELVKIMARLRGPDGCPWDKAQDFSTLPPYTIEETYELVESIEAEDWQELKGELGDLLFHIVFYARIAAEKGLFGIEDVAQAAVDKMLRRHPHVFGGESVADPETLHKRWQHMKAQERRETAARERSPAWDAGVPSALPALLWAYKLQQRAANLGFEWKDSAPVWDKFREECGELEQAVAAGVAEQVTDEFGDVLFSLVNLSRFLDVNPENALRQACLKFRNRLHLVWDHATTHALDLQAMSEAELEQLWESAKAELERRQQEKRSPSA